ncbi:hypothetical protein KFK09_014988 [Dendrobium nobile]|uniref:Uncharacterized protein n=1 Tax=Dendrobium nobile TaxID=94219 RepID=A0A8T3B4N7_DENNO|nr:hypothetical protein KFK09_014988 [Dendrobium nobile]
MLSSIKGVPTFEAIMQTLILSQLCRGRLGHLQRNSKCLNAVASELQPNGETYTIFMRFQDESGRASSSHSAQDEVTEWMKGWTEMDKMDELKETKSQDAFWSKLRAAAERKVGPANAERFCAAFKTVHEKLVYKELSLEAAQRFLSTHKTDKIRTES